MENVLEMYAKNCKMPSRRQQAEEKWLACLKTAPEILTL